MFFVQDLAICSDNLAVYAMQINLRMLTRNTFLNTKITFTIWIKRYLYGLFVFFEISFIIIISNNIIIIVVIIIKTLYTVIICCEETRSQRIQDIEIVLMKTL